MKLEGSDRVKIVEGVCSFSNLGKFIYFLTNYLT